MKTNCWDTRYLRRLLPVLLVLFCLFVTAPARGDEGATVYIAGYEYDGSTRTPCYWFNGARYMLPVTAGSSGSATAVAVSVRTCISRATNMTAVPRRPVTGATVRGICCRLPLGRMALPRPSP
jgi:hypothetical protein